MTKAKLSPLSLDVVFAGDLSGAVDCCLRIAGEAAAARQAGYRVGLLHLPSSPDETVPISPEIRALVQQSSTHVLDPEQAMSTTLLVVYPPCDRPTLDRVLSKVTTNRLIVVPGSLQHVMSEKDFREIPSSLEVSVAPTSVALREELLKRRHLRLEPRNWLPVVRERRTKERLWKQAPIKLGVIIPPDWPKAVDAVKEIIGSETALEVYAWRDRGLRRERPELPGSWRSLDGVEISMDWFLRRIDVLVLLQRPDSSDVPEAVIAAAQAKGRLVIAPTALIEHVPPGVITAKPDEIIGTARSVFADLRKRERLREDIDPEFCRDRFLRRLAQLTQGPNFSPRKKAPEGSGCKRRVLFLPKGGVGFGHVARLVAIARRAGDDYDPVFVSLSETAGLTEELGFRTEYIPSAAYAGVRSAEWDPWFQYELEQLIDAYQASAVVFDGSDPPAVLTRAVASRSWCHGVWVRRGMWAPGYNPSLQRSGTYDLIIEPGELSASRDRGATVACRQEALQVDPITLLDARELLSREAAAKAMGLDPKRPAVLLQLGSGENRNILDLVDRIIRECRRYPDLQIALAEWANGSRSLKLWPEITVLKATPLSLYFRAFDFSISAAGYNSFHEVVGFGLPTLFVPNQAPGMDDQSGRAAFAQEGGAAVELKENELHDLPDVFDLFMKPDFRSVVADNCRKLRRRNGAAAASRAIAELVH